MSDLQKRQLMDKKELVAYLNGKLSDYTAGQLTREGKIPVVKFPGIRRYFYEKEAIDRWINSLQNPECIIEPQKPLRMVR